MGAGADAGVSVGAADHGIVGDQAHQVLDALAEVAEVAHQLVELLLEVLGLEEDASRGRGVGIDRRERVEHVFQAPAQPSLPFHHRHGMRACDRERVTEARSRAMLPSTRGIAGA